jgi:uncharacterized damage-inducible protein DinB
MNSLNHYKRLLHYDRWANGAVMDAMTAARGASGDPGGRALKLLAHILGAEWLWLARLSVRTEGSGVWPELDLDHCRRQVQVLGEVWDGYLSGLSLEDLALTINYVNSKGQPWRSRVEDVLMHVVMHSAYHRGQIAVEMRSAGLTPAYTDFIQAVRAGEID